MAEYGDGRYTYELRSIRLNDLGWYCYCGDTVLSQDDNDRLIVCDRIVMGVLVNQAIEVVLINFELKGKDVTIQYRGDYSLEVMAGND